jgi:hypothetical protein
MNYELIIEIGQLPGSTEFLAKLVQRVITLSLNPGRVPSNVVVFDPSLDLQALLPALSGYKFAFWINIGETWPSRLLASLGKHKIFINDSHKQWQLEPIAEPKIRTYYINLATRTDRKEQIESELAKLDLKAQRFDAIRRSPGSAGCARSHAACLELAMAEDLNYVLILEDDFQLCQPPEFVMQRISSIISQHPELFVACLGFNCLESEPLDELVSTAISVQTTSAYIASRRAMPLLAQLFRESADKLEAGFWDEEWAIDQQWKKFQGSGKHFYISNPRLGIQRESFSDIGQRVVNYQC